MSSERETPYRLFDSEKERERERDKTERGAPTPKTHTPQRWHYEDEFIAAFRSGLTFCNEQRERHPTGYLIQREREREREREIRSNTKDAHTPQRWHYEHEFIAAFRRGRTFCTEEQENIDLCVLCT